MESYFLSYTHTRKVIYSSSKLSNYSHHRLQRHKLDQQNPGHRSKTDGKDEDEDDEGGKWKPAQLRHNGIFGLLQTEERAHASCGEADEQGGDQEKIAAADLVDGGHRHNVPEHHHSGYNDGTQTRTDIAAAALGIL